MPGRSKILCKTKWLQTQNIRTNKSMWTEEEDKLLRELAQKHGTKSWRDISNYFNKMFPNSKRTGKQCRDRWRNYINPDINK